jgi:hypothetical protein
MDARGDLEPRAVAGVQYLPGPNESRADHRSASIPMTGSAIPEHPSAPESRGWAEVKRFLLGRPRDLRDPSLFHRILLMPFLAWVGLGADGLSSSAYGPEEAFRTLGEHTYLAVGLALVTTLTVFVLAAAYSRIIEVFPFGGGGYLVGTTLIHPAAGAVAGSALLVDYVLTITVSIAAAGDALFSLLPLEWHTLKVPMEGLALVALGILNLRGVRESVLVLTPVFLLFIATHVGMIGFALLGPGAQPAAVAAQVSSGFGDGLATLGLGGMLLLFARAYAMGGGTYTGIEAVSNGLPVLREPRVHTGKRTMLYMALSLAAAASGLILAYLALEIRPEVGRTMNAVLAERVAGGWAPAGIPLGAAFVLATLLSEGLLLLVAAQTGMIDGPRVMANMALDSWLPHRFSSLSERLTTQNGVVIMTAGSLLALVALQGHVQRLVVMYSINVFITFLLSMIGMCRRAQRQRRAGERSTGLPLFVSGVALCSLILVITLSQKFAEGGWLTLLLTGSLVAFCFAIRRHYRAVAARLASLDGTLMEIPAAGAPASGQPDPQQPVAAVLVTSFNGLGIHTVLNVFRYFPGHFRGLAFVSVGVIDSGNFKGADAVERLERQTLTSLEQYAEFSRRLGMPAATFHSVGIEPVEEAEKVGLEVARRFPRVTFFAGQLIFQKPRWYDRWLHNETAFAIQRRLQWHGLPVVILPVRVSA